MGCKLWVVSFGGSAVTGDSIVFTGNIESRGTGPVYTSGNQGSIDLRKGAHVTFYSGSMQGDALAGFSGGRLGYVSLVFLGQGQKLIGKVSTPSSLIDLTVGRNADLTVTTIENSGNKDRREIGER